MARISCTRFFFSGAAAPTNSKALLASSTKRQGTRPIFFAASTKLAIASTAVNSSVLKSFDTILTVFPLSPIARTASSPAASISLSWKSPSRPFHFVSWLSFPTASTMPAVKSVLRMSTTNTNRPWAASLYSLARVSNTFDLPTCLPPSSNVKVPFVSSASRRFSIRSLQSKRSPLKNSSLFDLMFSIYCSVVILRASASAVAAAHIKPGNVKPCKSIAKFNFRA
mmetsp:Transcript_2119/g.5035  ORF Transcript_2119/g.5035 Transcript_2119/m.5035 type:complete len:225 (-) Transcript_2119:235-909(-)